MVFQPYNSPWYSGIDPLCPGLAISRILNGFVSRQRKTNTTFPDIASSDSLETLHFAMRDFEDESFISSSCHRKLMRDSAFLTVLDDNRHNY
ncbi:SpoVR family protein [Shigella flexneri]